MFFKTPTDIQKIIFSHMELKSLIKASQVSKQWHTLANNTLQYQKRVLGYRFLQIKNNPKLAEKFSLKEAVYGYISAQNNSVIDAINASSAYCQHMKDKLNKQEIEESFRWALSDESSLAEKQNFLNLIRNNPEWLRILSVKDAAEICIKAGNQQLGAVKHWYKKETGNDMDQYMKEHIPNANQLIVQILVKEALATHKPYYEISILGEIISKPELIQYLSVKDAAEICIKAGNRQLGALKYQYKKETGNDIDQYMREHIPNANQQITQILVKEALATHKPYYEISILGEIISKPELIQYLSVKDAAEICIKAGNTPHLNELKDKYKSVTKQDIDEEIKKKENLTSQETKPSLSLQTGY